MGHLEFHVKKNIINPSHSISRTYFRKAGRVWHESKWAYFSKCRATQGRKPKQHEDLKFLECKNAL